MPGSGAGRSSRVADHPQRGLGFAMLLISFAVMRIAGSLRQINTGHEFLIEYFAGSKSMTKLQAQGKERGAAATREDVQAILGNIDEGKLIEILDLLPTIIELEEAMVASAGNNDILGKSGHPLSAVGAEIADILARDLEDPARER
jgi:hypothetical protein